ncbi:MAG: BACON domain-containing protein, partial [Rikenellaceae bacterium]|nr:BACON domain-containing protein [Rikenellaceae bacterium]
MKHNKIFGWMLAIVAFVGLSVSCEQAGTQGGGNDDVTPYLELEADTLYLGYEANDEMTFLVSSHNLMWDVTYTENDWCTLTPNPSQGGGEILVAVTENTTGADRELVATVTNGDLAKQFVVLQSYNSV